MNLHEGKLYWPTTVEDFSYDNLQEDKQCDITIVGGGMSGLLCAYLLSLEGYKIILIEQNKIASGSSSANTGLLQFSSDIMLSKLAKLIGEEDAYLFYKMCLDAMDSLRSLPETIKEEGVLKTRNSLYLASNNNDLKDLKTEYKMLERYGFPVKFLNKEMLKSEYNVKAPGAILTSKDAEVNPVKFIVSLAKNINKDIVEIYENTKATNITYTDNKVIVKTQEASITSDYLIMTTGYDKEIADNIDKAKLNYTYAIATNRLTNLPWTDKSLIWETATAYLYARMTEDNRIIAGGLDEEEYVKLSNEEIFLKGQEILDQLKAVVPNVDATVDYAWQAVFGESTDELPFIGVDPNQSNKYYCLGFGGNGTVYSMAGAKIIRDLIQNNANPYAHIVKMNR